MKNDRNLAVHKSEAGQHALRRTENRGWYKKIGLFFCRAQFEVCILCSAYPRVEAVEQAMHWVFGVRLERLDYELKSGGQLLKATDGGASRQNYIILRTIVFCKS